MPRLYFYNGLRYGGLINKTICLFSLGKYSHVEIYFPSYNDRYTASPFSGTYGMIGDIPEKEKKKYTPVEITCSPYQEKVLHRCCVRGINMSYDYRGVFGCLFKWIKQDYSKYFCSEYILCGLQWVKLYKGETALSPNEMFERIKNTQWGN
jgi:hypothetical protein